MRSGESLEQIRRGGEKEPEHEQHQKREHQKKRVKKNRQRRQPIAAVMKQ